MNATPEKYATSALDREAENLARLEDGRRVGAHLAAVRMGSLVGAGALTHDEVEVRLLDAALANGSPEAAARGAIRRGMRYGEAHPRDLPTDSSTAPRLKPTTPQVPREAPPELPPRGEVAAFWAACRPLHEDAEVAAWVASRGLDVDAVELEVGPRALPPYATLPTWVRTRRGTWAEAGYRCIFPAFDADGRLATVRARAVVPVEEGAPKAFPPTGYAVRGALLADHLGRRLLAGERPDAWNGVAVVVEGEPDLLAWATNRSDANADPTYAVLGLVAGAWTSTLAARIPDGTTVVVRTHSDKAGDTYAAVVAATLRDRCDVRRSRRSA